MELFELARFFKVFGDETRLKILTKLEDGEICVHCLTSELEMSQTAISHQLAKLRDARLVKTRRDGNHIYYSLDDTHISTIINMGKEHLEEI